MVAISPCGEWRGSDLLLRVRVQTGASRDAIPGVENGMLKIRTTAAPVGGAANRKVIRLVADFLHVPPSSVTLIRGHKQRNKQLLISNPVRIPEGLAIAG